MQLYAGAGEREASRACAEDLVKLYGGAAEAGAAEAWLETAGAEDGEDREDGGKKAGKRRGTEER